jgi:two-component system, LuxR family, sensor kinase FixL
MNIRFQLILFFVLLAIIPLSIIGAMSYYNAKEALVQKQVESLEAIVQSRISHINHLNQRRFEQVRQMAGTYSLRQLSPDGDNSPEVTMGIQQIVESVFSTLTLNLNDETEDGVNQWQTAIEAIGVWDSNGTIIANSNAYLIGERMPDYFLNRLRERGGYHSGYYFDPLLEKNYIMILHEIRNVEDNRFAGVVIFKINETALNEISLSEFGLGETGELMIGSIDERDEEKLKFITRLRHAEELPEVRVQENMQLPIQLAVSGLEGTGIVEDYRGIEVLAFWKDVPNLDWGIVGKIDTAEIYAPIYALRNRIILLGSGIMLGAILLALYFSRSVSKPIGDLTNTFSGISKGKLEDPVIIKRKDEIGQLAASANQTIRYYRRRIHNAKAIADGDYSLSDTQVKNEDDLGNALKKMAGNLKKSRNKINSLLYESIEQTQHLKIQHDNLLEIHSRLEESEARLQAILESCNAGVITIDEKGIIQSFNSSAERIFGYRKQEVIGENVKLLMPYHHREKHDDYIKDYLETNEQKIIGKGREEHGLRKDGTIFPIHLSISEIKWKKNRIFSGIITDLTERKKLEQRILEISDEERRRIGHDLHDGLGQMLTGIRLVSENLARKLKANGIPGSDEVQEISEMAREADEYTRSLTQGMVQVELEKNGLSIALENLCKRADKMFGIQCIYMESGEIEIENHSMALNLFRIAQESINNAVKHGNAKNVTIRIGNSGTHLSLVIEDDGTGFDPQEVKRQGSGIQIMNYRAGIMGGILEIHRIEDDLTRVRCIIPLEQGKL